MGTKPDRAYEDEWEEVPEELVYGEEAPLKIPLGAIPEEGETLYHAGRRGQRLGGWTIGSMLYALGAIAIGTILFPKAIWDIVRET